MIRRLAICAAILASSHGHIATADDHQATRSVKPFVEGNILFGAHRGGRYWRPEETMKTFAEAVRTWPEIMLEADVRLTRDGVPVLMHDESVDRTTCASGLVSEYSLDELRALDAGCGFSTDDGATFPYRDSGHTITTLREALEAFPSTMFMIELKDQEGVAGPAVRAIQAAGAEDRVALASFNSRLMDEVKSIEPRIATCYSARTLMGLTRALRGDWAGYVPADDVLVMNYHNLSRYQISEDDFARIRAKGIRICLYNINDPEEMRHLLALGVDSMLTDVPETFAHVLSKWRGALADD